MKISSRTSESQNISDTISQSDATLDFIVDNRTDPKMLSISLNSNGTNKHIRVKWLDKPFELSEIISLFTSIGFGINYEEN